MGRNREKKLKIVAIIYLMFMTIFMAAGLITKPPPENAVQQQIREEKLIIGVLEHKESIPESV